MLEKVILFPYYLTLTIRHALYDKGIWKVAPTEKPSICVGNIAVGGTGKTPHTEMVLSTLLKSDEWAYKNVAVLSRGHKRRSRSFQQVPRGGSAAFYGDEPLQIKNNFPAVTVAVDRNRVEGCGFLFHPETLKTAKAGHKCIDKDFPPADIVVLDDAYQYRDLHYNYNIVLTDYGRPVNKDSLLPFGHLRDLPSRLNYAETIIVTKCPAWMEDWEKTKFTKTLGIRDYDIKTCKGVNQRGKTQLVLFTAISHGEIKPVYEEADRHYLYSKKLILFSGIAQDTPLRNFLSDKYEIVRRFKFPDHHKFTRMDIRSIMRAVNENPTAVVVTTEKDSQRLLDYKHMPDELKNRLFQIPIRVNFLSEGEQEAFEDDLFKTLGSPDNET
ncbi:MAG: tetraacyldisaccharide 4'-kinase [Bacteroidales bacterium]|nr:tetraacyldisaccharide 4'-kinase [Bacteroidales bacterium]MBQ9889329.1 tetraacyldisaccharide 4'-kinase [Bacteroidales bacterium]